MLGQGKVNIPSASKLSLMANSNQWEKQSQWWIKKCYGILGKNLEERKPLPNECYMKKDSEEDKLEQLKISTI